ncbi:hypothetical protein [Wielerella bovis]|uniref:hypothetical protein n=1 Tax=Wielerella bovis TaxID=2917790 RepID=UPI002019CA66|nr:hypothetical protein [Wielerella bovis]MCG7658071.1 hypothetical protein [Wielerella bovis]MCG7660293.1 hypothetical protein [Wielerella bovis]ULJ60294.1 hypothetical protein MIS44_11765 [Wielerella bovis]ULJ62501.1 hypothetical protein MIS46_11265 [Wielerella bovis]ULJ64725.1 hypothetical protein MIS33_11535 [Wielerella bovis]
MLGIGKGTIITAAVAYGLYYYVSTHDVAPFPPSESVVKSAIKKRGEYQNYKLEVTKKCRRTGGKVWERSIFTCTVEFVSLDNVTDEHPVKITKINGQWVMQD